MAVKTNEVVTSTKLANTVVEAMQEKKGIEICTIDLRHVKNAIADYFVICSGNSDTQVDALQKEVDAFTRKKINEKPFRIQGEETNEWVLLDYANVIVHVFLKNKRAFYGLEELWGDGKVKFFK